MLTLRMSEEEFHNVIAKFLSVPQEVKKIIVHLGAQITRRYAEALKKLRISFSPIGEK